MLRLRDGEPVSASDGRGGWRPCRLAGGGLEPAGPVERAGATGAPVTVALAVPKGDRAEWAVQKLVEIGVDRIVPLTTERSVVRWAGERAARHRERWEAVARAAAMQSRRVWLPEVAAVATLAEVLAAGPDPAATAAGPDAPAAAGRDPAATAAAAGPAAPAGPARSAIALAEPGGPPPHASLRTVLVGPEGGWSPAEVAGATGAGAGTVGLGPGVLRTETAAVVAATLLVALRAGVVRPA